MSNHRPDILLYRDDGGYAIRIYRFSDVSNGDTLDLSKDYARIANVIGMSMAEAGGGNGFKFTPVADIANNVFPPILTVNTINNPRSMVYLFVSGLLV